MDRIDLYLQWNIGERYVNTPEEQNLVTKFNSLYAMSKSARDTNELASPENIAKWRRAYYGTLSALDISTGEESTKKSRPLRKLIYEMVESKIDNNIPKPKLKPKYKTDLPLVEITEDYIKYEADKIFTKYVNDKSERATYVDGTSWYKVWWDSLDRTHDKSGNVKVAVCLADQIVPQPGIIDYRNMEYIFEIEQVSLSRIYDLYGRLITTQGGDNSKDSKPGQNTDLSTITVVNCYYLNENRIVGKFSWAKHSLQVICNEKDWQIRKLRTCLSCNTVSPQDEVCPICGSKSFKFKNATTEELDKDLLLMYNPYDVGETDDEEEKDKYETKVFATAGTEIPYYHVRQLPFIPRPAVSSIDSIYGISEAKMLLEMQDAVNKILTKALDKTLKSGNIMTKSKTSNITTNDDTMKVVSVSTVEEANMIKNIQHTADTAGDIVLQSILYDSSKETSGITNSFQGKQDNTATSGKAKEFSAMQTAGRIESLRVMKASSFAGVYDLTLKYLLAFSDNKRKFVKVLPDGSVTEQMWSKYMFLDKDENGVIYYRDDFSFDSDPAATLSQDRVAMWQETQDKFMMGALGDPSDPRTLELYWNMMEQLQYPLAKIALSGIKDNSQHLPPEIEQLIMQNPEILQMAMQMAEEQGMMGDNRGGARPNSGPEGNGFTNEANVEKTNERNRVKDKEVKTAVGGNVT